MDKPMECRKCRYWLGPQTEEGKNLGECHRRAPRAGREKFPLSDAANFCGEYKPKHMVATRGAGAEEDSRRPQMKTTVSPIGYR